MHKTDEITIFTAMSTLAKKHKAINLGQGFPDFDCDDLLKTQIISSLQSNKNQYCHSSGLLELRQTLANKIELLYNQKINAESQICITAGATQALFTAILALIGVDDEVIVIEPAYDSYIPSIVQAGGVPVSYRMKYPEYKIDWDKIKSLISSRTKMIIINSPHNPTGQILESHDMLALEAIVMNRDITVLSDEVYEHLIYDDHSHHSVLRYPNLLEQSIAVYSFGKTLHATGWKIGYCVGAEKLITKFKSVHQWNVFSVNSFIQHALSLYLQDPNSYNTLSHFFSGKRDYLKQGLSVTPLKPLPSYGTYFQLYDFSSISEKTDIQFAKYLTTEIGVAAIPLSPFYTTKNNDKVIRLCFAKKESTLDKAIQRLAQLT